MDVVSMYLFSGSTRAFGWLLALCVPLLAPSVTGHWDFVESAGREPYLIGTLTWTGNTGRIVWAPTAASEDNRPVDPHTKTMVAGQDASGAASLAEPAGTDVGATAWEYDRFMNDGDAGCVPGDGVFWGMPCAAEPSQQTSGQRIVEDWPSTVFTSEPLPDDLYINVTRGFQVLMFLQYDKAAYAERFAPGDYGGPCQDVSAEGPDTSVPDPTGLWGSNFDFGPKMWRTSWTEPELPMEITQGTKILGGTPGAAASQVWTDFPRFLAESHPDPAGYRACYFQMVSEVLTLEKGSTITLTINHPRQQYWYPFGLSSTHSSKIVIWRYAPEDFFYRFPEMAPGASADEGTGTTSGGSSGSAAALAMVFLAALPAVAATRDRSRFARMAVLLLLASAASGCLSGGGGPKKGGELMGGSLSNSIFDDTYNLTAAGSGAILGVVHDDLHLAIPGVHVSMTQLTNFTKTDGLGKFQFYNLTPGTYRLRFDHASYKTLEDDVRVEADRISKPDVLMLPKVLKQSDFRPHNHDYWDGAPQKALGTFTVPAPRCIREWTECGMNGFLIPPAPADQPVKTILPGTATVEVKLNWAPSQLMGVEKLGLYVFPEDTVVGRNNFWDGLTNDWDDLYYSPRGPNQPFFIQTPWEMADNGHARRSAWQFRWFIPTSEAPTGDAYRESVAAGYQPGPVSVTITTVRAGVLPLEPAHPDPWLDDEGLPVDLLGGDFYNWGTQSGGFEFEGTMPPPQQGQEWPCLSRSIGLGPVDDCYWPRYPLFGNWMGAPHGSVWAEATLSMNHLPAPQPYDVKLLVHLPTFEDPGDWGQSTTGYQTLEPYSSDGTTMKYRFKLKPENIDDIYTRLGNFWYMVKPATPEDETNAWLDQQYYNNVGQELDETPVSFTFTGFVHRTPYPG